MTAKFDRDSSLNSFKKGIDFQRERFKSAKSGDGINNFDLMCDSIENIKSEIKSKIKRNDPETGIKTIKRIERIISWYRNIEEQYTIKTRFGLQVKFPRTLHNKVNNNLTIAFEILIDELDKLQLL
jgi:hypothetical protein